MEMRQNIPLKRASFFSRTVFCLFQRGHKHLFSIIEYKDKNNTKKNSKMQVQNKTKLKP